MDLLWFVPLSVLLVVALVIFFKAGTKRPAGGESRLEQTRWGNDDFE
jgi:hypothetical protein